MSLIAVLPFGLKLPQSEVATVTEGDRSLDALFEMQTETVTPRVAFATVSTLPFTSELEP